MSTHPPVCPLINCYSPRGPYKGTFLCSFFLLLSFPTSQAVTCPPPLLLLAPWPWPDPDLPHGFSQGSALTELFLYLTSPHSLLIALMMEVVWNSEMMVNLYQPTWCYNTEHCHLYWPPWEPQIILGSHSKFVILTEPKWLTVKSVVGICIGVIDI
jgi:hypothetical protein